MDFLKLLKSFEEFIYEALTWLVLVPRTLLRIVASPLRMTAYVDEEMDKGETRFRDAVSPPLLLILCVLLAHFIDLAMRAGSTEEMSTLGGVILASEQNLLLYRTIAFGVWALAGSICLLITLRQPIDRETLRRPFYEQCYFVAPFALALSICSSLILMQPVWTDVVAVAITLTATAWFFVAEAAWIRRRGQVSMWRALLAAVVIVVSGSLLNFAVGYLLTQR
ncbi:hypothetical protein [Tahibacter sp.]|uniref:hypothetical protein n=1 Tax=Tahibacter sp. TaxID=2056211 RepID=UPI0028C3B88D|nr:hypothetical protein [Tahibacter sp.]